MPQGCLVFAFEEQAMSELPRLNGAAPDFAAVSTHGPVSLADYKGRWLILFSHPADFTPVCSTELAAFARRAPDFATRNTALLGLSVDSVFAHIAWTRNLADKMGVEIPFPIIADLDMRVARSYGMIHPESSETATVRCVFFIDPQQRVRAMVHYPMSCGRNVAELLRLLDGLQTADEQRCATPENWHPGEPVLQPPPRTSSEAAGRMQDKSVDSLDWYFGFRKG